MGKLKQTNQTNNVIKAIYDKLYEEYNQLHDYYGRGANDVMKRLKQLNESMQ